MSETTTFNKIVVNERFTFRDKLYQKIAEKETTRKVRAGTMHYNATSITKGRTDYHLFIGGERVEV